MSPAAPAEQVRFVDRVFRAALWIAYRVLLVGWFVFRPLLARGYGLPEDADMQVGRLVRGLDALLTGTRGTGR